MNRLQPISQSHGFTLVELMIVVAIVGILASIAIPAYSDYLTRGRIPEAIAALSTKRVKLEQYFQDHQTYVGATDCGNDTSGSYFNVACSSSSATGYILTATGKGPMAGFSYTVDQSNAKTSAFTTPASSNGWSAPSPNNCWATRKGGQC